MKTKQEIKNLVTVILSVFGGAFVIWGSFWMYNHRLGVVHQEVYLIPKGFHQCGAIVYNIKDAPALQLKDGTITYRIPKDGIFHTSSPSDYGWASKKSSGFHDVAFYWVDDTGQRLGKIPDTQATQGGESEHYTTLQDGTFIHLQYSPFAVGDDAEQTACDNLTNDEATLKKMMDIK